MNRETAPRPARSSTFDGVPDNGPRPLPAPHPRSEDLNHSHRFNSRPNSPKPPNKLPSAAGHDDSAPRSSPDPANPRPNAASAQGPCSACGKPMQGAFVRALQTVFHLNCFKCMDCGEVVASKFFPIDGPDGKQLPLCERDYFRRLNLICAKCSMALRGSYITACNKKFHVEHFTCSLCPTLFGPQDSYYEHDGDVYCHFHYSTRFATKCAGCNSAILKQFVEINRNSRDECWHPECYMINKFWNVKVASRRPTSSASSIAAPDAHTSSTVPSTPTFLDEESQESPSSLREKQSRMEQQVYRIWTVLSAFEESSAACISDMLRQVSNGAYLDAIRMAEKFILHVEVLFATIDDLEFQFAKLNMKGMSHVREARMLCRKTVELFTLLSHTQETGVRRMGMTQELLALVTGLAHYLKILIRIALTGALKLERDHASRESMTNFLDKLHLLAVQGANPGARRLIRGSNGEPIQPTPGAGNYGTQCVTYGFRSLAPENAGESPFSVNAHRAGENSGEGSNGSSASTNNPPSDMCAKCGTTVEEDCVRLGTYQRWHSKCVQCLMCGKVAAVPLPPLPQSSKSGDEREPSTSQNPSQPSRSSTQRRPPANVGEFVYDPSSLQSTPSSGEVPTRIHCVDHAHPGYKGGFHAVQRLEQYAFLLNVALLRLYLLLKKQGVVPAVASPLSDAPPPPINQLVRTPPDMSDPYRNSSERMKSVYLDRKLSATARLPKRSTIVEGPASGAVAVGSSQYAQASGSGTSSYPQGSSSSYSQQTTPAAPSSSAQNQYQQPRGYDSQAAPPNPPSPQQQQASYQAPSSQTPYRPPQPPPQQQSSSKPNNKMLELPDRLAYTDENIAANVPVPGSPSTSGGHGSSAGYSLDEAYGGNQQQPQPPPPPAQQQQLYQPQAQYYQHPLQREQQQYTQQQQYQQYPQQQQYYQQQQPSGSSYQSRGIPQGSGTSLTTGGSTGSGDALTLADIPSLMEAAQAREQHRSLPRESSIPYISELSPLELAIVKHCAVLALTRSPLRDAFDLEEILEMVETKKSTFWNKLFSKGEKGLKGVKKKGVFGVPLELLAEREGVDSMLGFARVTIRVPSFIDDAISAMRTMDMSVEGIFRKNGNIKRLKDLTEAIDRDPASVDLTQDNPVQLAALLKKFLRDLPDPLMTFKLHRLLIASQSLPQDEDDRKRYLHLISLIMPKSHRDTMEVLFVFLKWVASFAHMDAETGSKMDLGNLATVICPSILYSRGRDALRDETFGALRVVTSLLENQDEFFLVPQEFLPILQDQEYFANALELPSKEFLKKVDMYMKVKGGGGAGGRTPGPGTPFLGGQMQMQQQQGMLNGSPVPRYPSSIPPPLSSPTMERPPLIGGGDSRSGRPSPNTTPQPQQPQQGASSSSSSNHGHGVNGSNNGYFGAVNGGSPGDYQQQQQLQILPQGSPSMGNQIPQGMLQQQQQRTPPMGGLSDWTPPPLSRANGAGTPSGSRPPSVVGHISARPYNGGGGAATAVALSSSPLEGAGNQLYGSPPTNGYLQQRQR